MNTEPTLHELITGLSGPTNVGRVLEVAPGTVHAWVYRGFIPDPYMWKLARMCELYPSMEHLNARELRRLYGKRGA